MTFSSLAAALSHHATTTPQALCTLHLASGAVLTYAQVLDTTQRLVVVLGDLGVDVDHRVVFGVRNHWLHLPLLIACGARRARLVPVDPELHTDVLTALIAEDPTRTVSLQSAADLLRQIGAVDVDDLRPLPEPHTGDVLLMLSTSGTTGAGKRVMLTDANLVGNASALATRYDIASTDRFMCTLPTHHMNAIMITGLVPLIAGASVVLDDVLSFKNAKHYWRNVEVHGVTVVSLVPSIMALLLRLFPRGADHDVARLRLVFCGAAPLSAAVWRAFEERFGVPVMQGYGLTETTCWAVSTLPGAARDYTSVGVPLPGCAVRIEPVAADIDGVTDSSVGEVVVGGSFVFAGYSNNAAATAATLTKDGALRTGDLGFFDDVGQLHISGRLKEIVIRNGVNIFAPELDRLLAQHPSIDASKTIGLPDDLVGERVCCVCVRVDGDTTTEAELRAWLQARLSRAWWPDSIELVGALPRGGAGKIVTNTLRQIVTHALADDLVTLIGSRDESDRDRVQRALVAGVPVPLLARVDDPDDDDLLLRLRDRRDALRRPGLPPAMLTVVLRLEDDTQRTAMTERAEGLGFDVINDDDDDAVLRDHPDHVFLRPQASPR